MADAYATAADIAAMYRITIGHVYLLAHRGKWRRTHTRRPRRYHLGDVQATWDARHANLQPH